MAQQFYISNGVDVNAGWAAHIAVSVDGNKWETIPKEGLKVSPVTSKGNTSSPLRNKEKKCRIEITRTGEDFPVVSFDVENVANQPTWLAGATNIDKCMLAVADITTWLGECCASGAAGGGLATEAKQDAMIAELMKMIDWEVYCVKDIVTEVIYLMDITKNESTGAITIVYRDATGAVVVPPNPSDLRVCDSSAIMTDILAELQLQSGILQDIDDNTDDLESIATSSLTELQAINLNTDGIEALLTAGNVNTAAINTELQGQTIQLNTIIAGLGTVNTNLTTLITAVQTADTNNQAGHTATQAELVTIQGQITTAIAALNAIDANTAPLEASLTAIENAINTQSALQITELQTIVTNTQNTVTELQTIVTQLTSIEGQLTGTEVTTRLNISGVAATVVAPATYKAMQLIVTSGTVSDGVISYPVGTYEDTTFANKTLGGVTFNATGATAYLKLQA